MPSWRSTLAAAWVVGAVVSTVTVPDPACQEVACTVDWGFAAALAVGLLSVGLLWWRPLLALGCGAAFGAAEAILDPQLFPRVWFGLHGALCLVVAGRILVLRRGRARVLRRESRPVTVPDWVRSAASRGPAPLAGAERVWPGVAALAAGAALLGVTAHDVAGLQAHRERADRVTAVVVEAQTPWLPTLEITEPAGGVRRVQLETWDELAPGDRVEVLLDRTAHPQWVELVDEPADPSWQLLLALLLLVPGAAQVVGSLRAERARRRLLSGTHPGVRVLASRQLDGPPGTEGCTALATLSDRLVVAHTRPDRVLGRPGVPTPHSRGSRQMPVRPVLGTLYGQLHEGGWAAFLADDTVALPDTPLRATGTHDLRLLELEVTDEVTSVGATSGQDTAALAWALGRRAFRGLAPAQPAPSLPGLPWTPRAAPRDLAEGTALLLVPVATWLLALGAVLEGMPRLPAVLVALALAVLCVRAAAPRLARSFVVTEQGLRVDGQFLPWSWVRLTASGRGRVHLVVAGPPEDSREPTSPEDLGVVRSRPLRPDDAFVCAAVVEALRRRPAPGVAATTPAPVDRLRRFVGVGVVVHLLVAAAVLLLSRT